MTQSEKARLNVRLTQEQIASRKDQITFFKAIANPPIPNNALIAAKNEYLKLLSE